MTDKTEIPRRVRRSITPARLYREIQQAQTDHQLVDLDTIKALLEAILQDVLRDALDE